MNKSLFILWTIALVCNIISCVVGNPANWVLVFCPLISVWTFSWERWQDEKKNQN